MELNSCGVDADSSTTIGARAVVNTLRPHGWLTRGGIRRVLAALSLLVFAGTAQAQATFSSAPPIGSSFEITTGIKQTTSVPMRITNTGTTDLLLDWSVVGGGGWITFDQLLPARGSTSIMPGESRDFRVNCFAPTAGTMSGTLNFVTNDSVHPSIDFPVTCNGAPQGPQCPVIKVSGDGQTVQTGNVSLPLEIKQGFVTSSVPPSGEIFTWTITGGDAVFASNGTQSITANALYVNMGGQLYDANNAQAILANSPGTITVSVNSGSCNTSTPAATYTMTIVPPPPATITILEGQDESGPPGTVVSLLGRFDDVGGSRAKLGGVNAQLTISSGSARFAANNGQTIVVPVNLANGQFGTDVILGPGIGAVAVTVTGPNHVPATWNLTTEDPGVPPPTNPNSITVISGSGQVGLPGTRGQDLVVEVRNEFNQLVVGEVVNWSVGFGFSVDLDGTSSTTGADGRARMGFTYRSQSGSSTIVAQLIDGESAQFDVTASTGGLDIISGNNQSGLSGTKADEPIVFQLTSNSGVAIPGATISFQVTSGSASLEATSLITDAQGRTFLHFDFGNTPGPVRIQASTAAGDDTVFADAIVLAATLIAESGNGQSAAVSAALPDPLVVQLAQAASPGGNRKSLAGVNVTWEVLSGGGQLGSPNTTTDANGESSNTYTMGATPGVNQIRASTANGASVIFTATATGGSGAGVRFQIASGDNQTLPTNLPSAPLVVRVTDTQGNPLADRTVTWRFTPGANGSVNPTSSITDANGQASTVATVGLPGPAAVEARLVNVEGALLRFTINGGVQNIDNLTPNQQEVGAAIDAACPLLATSSGLNAEQQDLLQRCSELVVGAGPNPGGVQTALDQMLADEAQAQGDAALSTTSAQFDNLKARIAALRSGSGGSSFGGLALASSSGVLPLSFLPTNIVQDDAEPSGEAGASFSRWGFFATGTIGRGDQDRTDANPGFDFDTYGLTAGVDYRYSDNFVLGAALGYTNNDTDIGNDQGKLETKGYSLSGYATYYTSNSFYTDAVLTWGRNSYDLSRRIRYSIANLGGGTTTVDQVATASPDGDQRALAVSLGRDFARGAWNLGPYLRATYTKIDFDPYIERMSNPSAPGAGLAMAVSGRELKSLEGVLGGKASYTMSTSWGVLMPNITLEWLHEFEDDPTSIVTRFANDPSGTPIVLQDDEVDTNYFNLGVGLSGVFANGRSAFVYYEHRAGQADFSSDSLAIGVRIEF